jgi:uncharacterized protein YqeY
MSLKEQIQKDFLVAMKTKNDNAKSALSGLKAAITLAEKVDGVENLTDDGVTKVLIKAIKQREESLEIYQKAGREDLYTKEANEAAVLRNYLPKQMATQEIREALIEIFEHFKQTTTNISALQGKSIGEFNKKYNGRANLNEVKEILNELIK